MHTIEIILHAALFVTSLTFLLLMAQLKWETSAEGWGSMLLAVSGVVLGVSFWVGYVEVVGWVVLVACLCFRVFSVLKARKK